jgi:hypothetical protein
LGSPDALSSLNSIEAVDSSRVGAAIGAATVGGDRHVMVAGAVAAVLATLVAWRSGRTAIRQRNSLVQIAISRSNHATDRAWDASICE